MKDTQKVLNYQSIIRTIENKKKKQNSIDSLFLYIYVIAMQT